ncbi:DUF255 domain-containing protein [Sulfurimonas sp.]|jgi:thioredoxin-related protein|uniref:DUF255 domain-containing protein n=1 Tax=Sulfurimonas sp. TaxID=2022749 RepID=UPI0025F3622C|nr:DUF255 domain-containing protein [Sulfurimonas sp.]MBT5935392.1 thioredoxin family protein [Sulfurimonas sp.]
MKKLLLLLALLTSLFSVELGWMDDYKQALVDAKKENKLIYLLITSSTCSWCQMFKDITLQDKKLIQRLEKEFITVQLVRDFDKIPEGFESSPVPRHYFTDSDGVMLYNSLGYRDEETFEVFIDNAEEKFEMNNENKSKGKK